MSLDLVWRVLCDGEPMYFGLDDVLAQRIYEHLKTCAGHEVTLQRSELNWWRADHSPTTEGNT
jgi:hypothetical protein